MPAMQNPGAGQGAAVVAAQTLSHSSRAQHRQGWAIALGLALVLCIVFGTTLNSLSVFTQPIISALRCSNEQVARVATAFLISMTLAMPLAGWLLDRVAPRPVMTGGALLTALGYLLAGWSADIDQLVLAVALSGLGVGACTYVPAITLVTRWIPFERQGLAFGLLLAGGSIGAIIFPVLLTQVIAAIGWRGAMQGIAGAIVLVCVPLLLWAARLPARPASAEQPLAVPAAGHGIAQALRLPRYWLWIGMQLLLTLSSLGIFIALVPYLISVGYSAQQAAGLLAASAAAALVGNFVFGLCSQRWAAKSILLSSTLVCALGILCLLAAGDPRLGLAAVVLFTLGWGSTFTLVNQFAPMLLMEATGARNFASLLGIGNLVAGLGSAFSPEIVGYLVDLTQTYTLALLLCAGLAGAALLPIALQGRGPAPQ